MDLRRPSGGRAVGARVAGLGLVADQASEVGEERELLPHQRAVDAVLAGDLGEQATQLGGAVAGGLGGAGRDQRAEVLKGDGGGLDAERGAGALQQPGAILLEGAPKIGESLCDEGREHFAHVREFLDAYGVKYELVPTLVRGLDYYTRTTFEFKD